MLFQYNNGCRYAPQCYAIRTFPLFFSSPKRPDRLRDRPTLLFNKHRRVNPRGREADHSSLSSAEVKNQWSYTFTSPYTLMACTAKILMYRMSWCQGSIGTEAGRPSTEGSNERKLRVTGWPNCHTCSGRQ